MEQTVMAIARSMALERRALPGDAAMLGQGEVTPDRVVAGLKRGMI